jgi:hypothetical protein
MPRILRALYDHRAEVWPLTLVIRSATIPAVHAHSAARTWGVEMRKRVVPAAAALAVAVVVFLAGIALGAPGAAGLRPALMTADGTVGQQVATFEVGDTFYGFRASVPWRDAAGSEHDGGWPACLAPGEVTRVSFRGAVVWSGSVGQAEVLWVDCSGR